MHIKINLTEKGLTWEPGHARDTLSHSISKEQYDQLLLLELLTKLRNDKLEYYEARQRFFTNRLDPEISLDDLVYEATELARLQTLAMRTPEEVVRTYFSTEKS